MPTTNTTTGSNTSNLQFNPTAQSIYNQLISGGGNVLSGYMNNPFGNAAYTQGAQASQKGAQQAGGNNMQALMQNMLTSGIGGQAGNAFKGAQLAQTGRANSAMSSQANIQNVQQALQRQMAAAGTGLSFSPQLTGSSGTFSQNSSMGGLGTWLPQLLSAAGGAALGGATGGASSLFAPYTAGTGPNNVGSVNGTPNPALGNYGGMAGAPSSGLAGMLPAGSGPQTPAMPNFLFGNMT